MAIYMKFGPTKGNVSTDGYKDWIAIHSLQFGVGRGITSGEGRTGNRTASHASVSEVTVTKDLDEASLDLFKDALTGALKTEVEFAIVQSTDNKEVWHGHLWDAGLSGYSISTGGDRPSESISINFSKFEHKPVFFDDKGTATTPKSGTWDLLTLKYS